VTGGGNLVQMRGGSRGLSRTLMKNLRTGRGIRLRRRSAQSCRPRFAAHFRMIDERPAGASARRRIDDFEGDLIVGCHGLSAIGTLVYRPTVSSAWCMCPIAAGVRTSPRPWPPQSVTGGSPSSADIVNTGS
jgi:IS30 family transposase